MPTLLAALACLLLLNAMWLMTLLWVLAQKAHTPLSDTFRRPAPGTPEELDLSSFGDAGSILDAMLPKATRAHNPTTPPDEDESPIQ